MRSEGLDLTCGIGAESRAVEESEGLKDAEGVKFFTQW